MLAFKASEVCEKHRTLDWDILRSRFALPSLAGLIRILRMVDPLETPPIHRDGGTEGRTLARAS